MAVSDSSYETIGGVLQAISSAESSIKINSDNISLKVNKDGIISSINQSPESISINANKINLHGVVTANDNFKILTDGSMVAKNGTFSGTLSAAKGTFSGELQAATGTFKGNLSAAGGTFSGSLSAATGTFKGTLSAAGGTFKGELQAATGTFSGSLSAASGTFKGTVNTGKVVGCEISGGIIESTHTINDIKKNVIINNGSINFSYITYNSDFTQYTGLNNGVISPYLNNTSMIVNDNNINNLCFGSSYGFSFGYLVNNLFTPSFIINVIQGYAQCYGSLKISQNLTCSGTKNRLIATKNYNNRLQYCYEMSSPIFGDIGGGETDENGECYIYLDDIFSETVNTKIEYQVFLQKENKGDVWVDSKSPTFFIVKGTPNLKFSWEIKAKQLDYEYDRLEEYDDSRYYNEIDYETEYLTEINELISEQEETLYEAIE